MTKDGTRKRTIGSSREQTKGRRLQPQEHEERRQQLRAHGKKDDCSREHTQTKHDQHAGGRNGRSGSRREEGGISRKNTAERRKQPRAHGRTDDCRREDTRMEEVSTCGTKERWEPINDESKKQKRKNQLSILCSRTVAHPN